MSELVPLILFKKLCSQIQLILILTLAIVHNKLSKIIISYIII